MKEILYELSLIRWCDVKNWYNYLVYTFSSIFFFLSRIIQYTFSFCWKNYQFVPLKFVRRTVLWFLVWFLFVHFDFGSLWIIISLFLVVFLNLGERKEGELSAYSVFNKGFQRILGTIDIEQFENEIRHNLRWNEEEEVEEEDDNDGDDDGYLSSSTVSSEGKDQDEHIGEAQLEKSSTRKVTLKKHSSSLAFRFSSLQQGSLQRSGSKLKKRMRRIHEYVVTLNNHSSR
jgi:hypothetical protein